VRVRSVRVINAWFARSPSLGPQAVTCGPERSVSVAGWCPVGWSAGAAAARRRRRRGPARWRSTRPSSAGREPGLRDGRARGKKALVGIAVEVTEPKGIGRCRMAILADGSTAALHPFITANVEPGTRVITDAWQGYSGIGKLGYAHERRSQRAARARGDDPGELLPAVHRVASLPSAGCSAPTRARWTTRTWPATSTSSYSASTAAGRATGGLLFYRVLELAVAHDPVRYRSLVASPQPKAIPPTPPNDRGHPPSLNRPAAARIRSR